MTGEVVRKAAAEGYACGKQSRRVDRVPLLQTLHQVANELIVVNARHICPGAERTAKGPRAARLGHSIRIDHRKPGAVRKLVHPDGLLETATRSPGSVKGQEHRKMRQRRVPAWEI